MEPPAVVPEKREGVISLAGVVTAEPEMLLRFSTLSRLLRVTAWCLRWRHAPATTHQDALNPLQDELDAALRRWVGTVQGLHYANEVAAVARQATVSPVESACQVEPTTGRARVVASRRSAEACRPVLRRTTPVILPTESWLTRLIILACHQRTLHGGVQLTLELLRLKFWVPRGRAAVKGAIHCCVTCVRWRAATPRIEMGDLPRERVMPAQPFLRTGVDYAGPILIRTTKGRGHKVRKGFIAVFVCLCTKAVHLEAAFDYSTEAFLAAFRRFTSRRGLCQDVYSDCGTNFVGADRQLRELFKASSPDSHRITRATVSDGIRWHFNPPAAPHFGGLWEAAVKSVKHHLRRVIGEAKLTFDELSTFLAEVEACLNSRSLCALSDDPDDVSALTPGYFLIGAPLLAVPEASTRKNEHLLSGWRRLEQMRGHFWGRWSREYVQQVSARQKWLTTKDVPKVGSLCLNKNETTAPSRWPLARITRLHPGNDGVTRVVTIRTATSELVRPLIKLVLLSGTDSTS